MKKSPNSSRTIASTALWETRLHLPQGRYIYKDFATLPRVCDLTTLRVNSLTEYILKRQTEQTNKIKLTVENLARTLKREVLSDKGNVQTWSPLSKVYRMGKLDSPILRKIIPSLLSNTIVGSENTYNLRSRCNQECSRRGFTTTGDRPDRANLAALSKRLWK